MAFKKGVNQIRTGNMKVKLSMRQLYEEFIDAFLERHWRRADFPDLDRIYEAKDWKKEE